LNAFLFVGVLLVKKAQERPYSLLEFTLQPMKIASGLQKLRASIKNKSDGVLRNAVLLIHSLNENNLSVSGGEKFIYAIMPNREAVVDFRALVAGDTEVYLSLSGFKNGDVFFSAESAHYRVFVEQN
jgi:hypothetical protein